VTTQELKYFRNDLFSEAMSVSDAKSIEYTISSDDRLYNFKHVAERLGITPEQALMTYVLKHVDAICNDAKTGKQFSDETLRSRVIDLINYSVLLLALNDTHTNDNSTESIGDESGSPIGNSQNASEPDKWSVLSRTTKA
tara:strand:+ start:16 stop:435 length:420 start_codon:yes stop_codon:yes gene_type:complete